MRNAIGTGIFAMCAVLSMGCGADQRGNFDCSGPECDPAIPEASLDDPTSSVTDAPDKPTRPEWIDLTGMSPMQLAALSEPVAPEVEPDPADTDPEDTDPEDTDPEDTDPEDTDPEDIGQAPELILENELTPEEQQEIGTLRGAIFNGLDLGRDLYVDTLSIVLQNYDVDMEGIDGGTQAQTVSCPFAAAYDNGFEPDPMTCEFLADLAKVEAYSKLVDTIEDAPILDVTPFDLTPEAEFWREQGLISGIEEQRVVHRTEMTVEGICNTEPTPIENSAMHGLKLGQQLFIDHFNSWLGANGYVADYPTMSSKIQVCNVNVAMLEPAHKAAKTAVTGFTEANPLCPGYEPPTSLDQLHFAQANIDYAASVVKGVDDEFAKAAVTVFQVVPCNVSDPVVVDLDRDGIELLPVHAGVNFDLYAAGRVQAMSWVSADDGFLALDRNDNGRIDDGSELFGNLEQGYGDGFAHLSELDSDGDGFLTASDARFADLVVWRDSGSDGVSSPDELIGLGSLGVTSLPLQAARVNMTSAGNRIPLAVQAETESGPLLVADALLRTAPWPRLLR